MRDKEKNKEKKMHRGLQKEAFIGAAISKGVGKASGVIFGSAEHSMKSNIGKSLALSSLGTGIPGASAPTKIPGSKLTQGKGFKVSGLEKTSGLTGIKIPSIKGLVGSTATGTAPKSVLGSVAPAAGVSPKSVLAKSASKKVKGASKKSSITGMRGLQTIGLMMAGATAIKGADKLGKKYEEYSDKKKFPGIIRHARSENPELRKVPEKKLKSWMNTFHSLAPNMAKDEGMATSMLTTVHNYGGDVDLATAKIISEIGHKAKRDKFSTADQLGHSMSLLMD